MAHSCENGGRDSYALVGQETGQGGLGRGISAGVGRGWEEAVRRWRRDGGSNGGLCAWREKGDRAKMSADIYRISVDGLLQQMLSYLMQFFLPILGIELVIVIVLFIIKKPIRKCSVLLWKVVVFLSQILLMLLILLHFNWFAHNMIGEISKNIPSDGGYTELPIPSIGYYTITLDENGAPVLSQK